MENWVIENADIVVSGVALSDVYINKDALLIKGINIGSSNQRIKKMLNDKTRCALPLQHDVWKTEIINEDIFTELSKSHSAYKTISKREYIAICQLGSVTYQPDMLKEDRLGTLSDLHEKAYRIMGASLALRDVELRFYEFGNVTISACLSIRGHEISLEDYKILSDYAHAFFGAALRPRVRTLIGIYVDVMQEVDKNKDIELNMLKMPLQLKMVANSEADEEQHMKYVLDFSIRYHMIYSRKLRKLKDFVDPFKQVLTGEWEKEYEQQLRLKGASLFFGWTHSLVIMDDFDAIKSLKEFETYRFPLQVVLTNWGALHSLSQRLELGRAQYLKEIEGLERHIFRKKDYVKISDDIREFRLKVKRILLSLDSYTVSNNPMHYKLIEIQQAVFQESKSVDRINQQLEIVGDLTEELMNREKARNERRLNKILTMLTLFTVIDIANSIYNLIFDDLSHLSFIGGITGSLYLIFFIIYKFEPTKKNRRIY